MNSFTKLYKEERELLKQTNSVNCYEVYMHLKDKYNYFNENCYDLTKCISEYLDIPQRSVKDAIKRLKEVGLIKTVKRGKVNIYSFPIINKIEKGIVTIEETTTPPAEEEKPIIPIEIEKAQDDEEEMMFATTTVEDVMNNPDLSFLLDENEITLEDEVAIAANRLSNINDVAQYYKEMNSTVTKLHIKYNVSKKYVDEMINNKINKAA